MNSHIEKGVEEVEKIVAGAEETVSRVVRPIQQSAFRRFPTTFALLATLGFASTILGMERVITSIPVLENSPWLLILFGVIVLSLTGRLHKKLD